jgi:hypothetical protein
MNLDFFTSRLSNIGAFCIFLKNPKNSNYLDYLNSNIPNAVLDRSIPEKIYYLINQIKKPLLCYCGKHLSFIGVKNGYRKTCGNKACFVKMRKKTSLQNWGVDNPRKSKEIIEKARQTQLSKWGGHPMKSEEVKQKFKSTMMSRWGVSWAQQSDAIKSKSKRSWQDNPDKEKSIEKRSQKIKAKTEEEKKLINDKRRQTIELRFGSWDNFIEWRLEKIRQSSFEKWNLPHHFNSSEISKTRVDAYTKNKIQKIKSLLPSDIEYIDTRSNVNNTDSYLVLFCYKCNSEFEITRQLFYSKTFRNETLCLKCNPSYNGTSRLEANLFEFIRENYTGQIGTRSKIGSKEVDIYLPEMQLAFEFNGLWWHSSNFKQSDFHFTKSLYFKDLGINLIHVWEDDWLFNQDIVKSVILSKLKKLPTKIPAKKCKTTILSESEAFEFMQANHLSGFKRAESYIGLIFESEIVSLISVVGNNIVAYCCRKATIVVGGFSKMLSFACKSLNYEQIVAYHDLSYGCNTLLKGQSFVFEKYIVPNVYSIASGKRSYPADGNLTIYDAGYEKWIKSEDR